MKRLISIALVFLLILAACGTADQTDQTAQGSNNEEPTGDEQENQEDVQALLENLEMQAEISPSVDEITFDMELVNQGEDTIELSFSSGQQYEIIVINQSGEVVYQYSEGRDFTEALVEKELKSGESLKWTELWEYPKDEEGIEPGKYTAEITLLPAQVNKQVIEDNPFTVTKQFEIDDSEQQTTESTQIEGGIFKNVQIDGQEGQYTVSGEVNSSIEAFYYLVEDGHSILVDETEVATATEERSPFEFDVTISEDKLPINGTVMLIMYEKTEDGTKQSSFHIPLERFDP
ncbi:BsuPI-related putative proteinase inhibitor [Aquibacillus albus]|uniref:Intracellular proteinase inhibitor BsuPI domain-containing protein n=1 Tax=Aquibacillus albus TaxID=1168171 RepID=A0ABS2N023_9BACI|nr:BsuPI-related putative proteinase inhibitor [Aquibacillus albus]MBM7571509.1 hypothetical protein [Aquibacillus albus]